MFGDEFIGGGYLDGEIVDLNVSTIFGEASISWEHKNGSGMGHRLVVTMDGDIIAILPEGSTSYNVTGLNGEIHRLEVFPIRADVRRLPDFHGHFFGRRGFLRWTSSNATDLASYNVHWDNATGSIDGSHSLGTVSRVLVQPLWLEPPATGTGSGRITLSGNYTGDIINQVFTIQIGADGFRHNLTGSFGAYKDFQQHDSFTLPYDIRLNFEDARTEYDTGDTYTFRIGPACYHQTGILPANNGYGYGYNGSGYGYGYESEFNTLDYFDLISQGEYLFGVSGEDQAGNVSAVHEIKAVRIVYKPDDVSAIQASWDGTNITLSWVLPDTTLETLIYSNYNRTFERLQDNILIGVPYDFVGANETEYPFTPPESGLWKFYVRTRDANGRISESVEMVSIDTTELPTGVQLNEPENITVRAIAAGHFRISFNYPLNGGSDVTDFNFYIYDDSETPDLNVPQQVIEADGIVTEIGNVLRIEFDTASAFIGTKYITIRATDGEYETTNVDNVEGRADATAPDFPTNLFGGSN